jgi:glutamate racemase
MRNNPRHAIGVFDSGVGGLTVVRALMERAPFENIIYFGDTARVPYGVKSVETIARYATQIAEFLLQQDVKLLIIACNTMAAVANHVVKELSPVPVLDVIDAGARSAVAGTKEKRIGVIGTLATINSNAYARAIHQYDPSIKIFPRRVRYSFRWLRKDGLTIK